MKTTNIIAAVLFVAVGVLAFIAGFADKDVTDFALGLGMLVSALLFGTFSTVLLLLEGIREELRNIQNMAQRSGAASPP